MYLSRTRANISPLSTLSAPSFFPKKVSFEVLTRPFLPSADFLQYTVWTACLPAMYRVALPISCLLSIVGSLRWMCQSWNCGRTIVLYWGAVYNTADNVLMWQCTRRHFYTAVVGACRNINDAFKNVNKRRVSPFTFVDILYDNDMHRNIVSRSNR